MTPTLYLIVIVTSFISGFAVAAGGVLFLWVKYIKKVVKGIDAEISNFRKSIFPDDISEDDLFPKVCCPACGESNLILQNEESKSCICLKCHNAWTPGGVQ